MKPATKTTKLKPSRWARYRGWIVAGLLLLSALSVGAGCQFWAWYQFQAGEKALHQQRFTQARKHLEQCVNYWSHRPRVWILLGQTARRTLDVKAAERCYVRALELLEGQADADLTREQWLMRVQQGDLEALPSDWQRQATEKTSEAVLLLEAAVQGHLRRYRYRDAAKLVDDWLSQRPNDVSALVLQGQIQEQIGPRGEAISSYRRALILDPDHPLVRLRLTNLLLEQAQPGEALAVLGPLLAVGEPGGDVQLAHAQCLFGIGDLAGAVMVVDKVLAGNKRDSAALTLRGQLAIAAQNIDLAESLLTEAIRWQPSNHEAHFQLYQVMMRRGEEDKARQLKIKMDQLEKDSQRLRHIFAEDLAQKPNDPQLHLEIGSILFRSGEPAKGLPWLQNALRLDPKNRDAHRLLAEHYRQTGDEKAAAIHASKAANP